MQQGAAGGGGSKLETGTNQLVRALRTLGSTRWVLIDGATRAPRELEAADALSASPAAGPTSAPSDIPGLLEAARDYIKANNPGRTEVWICSDMRRNDWNAEDGRWRPLREAFLDSPRGVRFHLLAYPRVAPGNLAVRVTDVRRQEAGDGAELLVSLRLSRDGEAPARRTSEAVPVQFEIGGARSEVIVEMAGTRAELKDHRIPLERSRERGWGKVSIPADANPADNEFFFGFDQPAPRRAVVVADDAQVARALQLVASIPPDPGLRCSAEVVAADQLAAVDWGTIALLLWQGPVPGGDFAKVVRSFIDRGGRALFFPPREPAGGEFLGVRWTTWSDGPQGAAVENWRGDQDLLAHTRSGTALPVGELQVRRCCGLSGEATPLATLRGGAPLLARVTTDAGGAYFCATTPAPGDSSLAGDGIVFYALVQRALAAGAEALEGTRQLAAGEPPGDDPTRWNRLAGPDEAVSTDFPLHRGVYDSGGRLLAVNRPEAEDAAPVVADDRVAGLFRGLDFARVDDQEGNAGSLIREIWRLFLASMMVALVVEAGLCLPKPARAAGGAS
jgi:hypothetical protein